MKEIADILMKQLRMIGELSRSAFEKNEVLALVNLTSSMIKTTETCIQLQALYGAMNEGEEK